MMISHIGNNNDNDAFHAKECGRQDKANLAGLDFS